MAKNNGDTQQKEQDNNAKTLQEWVNEKYPGYKILKVGAKNIVLENKHENIRVSIPETFKLD